MSMDDELTEEQMANLPTVVLVKKKYRVGKHRRARQRRWKLRQLAVEEPDAAPTKAVERARAEEREAFYQVSQPAARVAAAGGSIAAAAPASATTAYRRRVLSCSPSASPCWTEPVSLPRPRACSAL